MISDPIASPDIRSIYIGYTLFIIALLSLIYLYLFIKVKKK